MQYLVEIPVDGAEPVLMEVHETEDTIVRSARPGEVIATATENFDVALTRFQSIAHSIVSKFRAFPEGANEIGVEFGIKANMDARLVVARTSAEANFKVTLQWRRP